MSSTKQRIHDDAALYGMDYEGEETGYISAEEIDNTVVKTLSLERNTCTTCGFSYIPSMLYGNEETVAAEDTCNSCTIVNKAMKLVQAHPLTKKQRKRTDDIEEALQRIEKSQKEILTLLETFLKGGG